MPRVLSAPDAEAAHGLVLDGLDSGALVTLFGRCMVEYDGRASSTLGPGDRHIMCKPDGTVLVHTDAGHQPVNWQPPGCEQTVRVEEGDLHLQSERTTPEEHLHVSFSSIDHAALFQMRDEEELSLEGTEADLRSRILDAPDLVETGFQPLATERETPAGAVDIYGEDSEGRIVVVELKRRRVGPDAVGQLSRYVEALERDLPEGTELRGILVAPSVTDRARGLLAEKGLEFVALEP